MRAELSALTCYCCREEWRHPVRVYVHLGAVLHEHLQYLQGSALGAVVQRRVALYGLTVGVRLQRK